MRRVCSGRRPRKGMASDAVDDNGWSIHTVRHSDPFANGKNRLL